VRENARIIMSKGSGRRASQIDPLLEDLRWELWRPTTTAERKAEIKEILAAQASRYGGRKRSDIPGCVGVINRRQGK
jgi:hypothetical protein